MSKRPSSTFNDPGYFYNQRRLLVIFTLGSLAMVAGILAMIWADFDRPWKHEQRAERVWEAERAAAEGLVLETQAQDTQRELEQRRKKAVSEVESRQTELNALRAKINRARGQFKLADMAYKAQKQYTGQADYEVSEASSPDELKKWQDRLVHERDEEMRLRDASQLASQELDRLLAEEKRLQADLDAVVAAERGDDRLKRLQLIQSTIEKKKDYTPLREIPLLDFLAPPVKVEQVVLDNLVDNYEFSKPKKVDRCVTCHIGATRSGFEEDLWPVEVLSMPEGKERADRFDRGLYLFVRRIVESWVPRVGAKEPYHDAKEKLRELQVHNETLGILFKDYDPASGAIGLDEKGRKIARRWIRGEDGRWVESDKGHPIADYYLGVLQKMRGHWRTHPHSEAMVGDSSPHPYEKVGCTVCHQGRGWSTDFGFAYHTPDRERVEDWMTDERAHEQGAHLPVGADEPLDEAMTMGNPEGVPAHVGYVTDEKTGEDWEEHRGWIERKRHYWAWPQLPLSLVQSSCLKCHKEGMLHAAEPEYADVRLGKPDPQAPSTLPWELQAEAFNNDPAARDAGEYANRMFIPADPEPYRAENLEKGMSDFLEFGCYGCHKLDPGVYPFMEHVRPKVGPQLDDLSTKTNKEWVAKWIRNPKDFRPDTRMPRFWGLSNNSHDFSFRFAERGQDPVDGAAWSSMEVYAISEYLWARSQELTDKSYPPVDLSKGDPARGERILVGDYDASEGHAKACVACHEVPITTESLKYDAEAMAQWTDKFSGQEHGWTKRMARRHGPSLKGIGSKVRPEWIVAWLKNPRSYWHETVMPDLRLTDQEALDVASYLVTQRNADFDALPGPGYDEGILLMMAQELRVAGQKERTEQAIAVVNGWSPRERALYVGGQLVKHYGCFGCHQIHDYRDTTPIGTELTEWGSKLIERLAYNHVPVEHTRFDFAYTKLINPRIYDYGMPARDRPYERLKMPRFGFQPEEAHDIATFLVSLVSDPIPPAARFVPGDRQADILRGRQIVHQYNCQGCHMVENEGGDIWPVIAKEKWRPPNLLGQGLKTQPQWLFQFMKNPAFVAIDGQPGTDRVRPWHSIRMPTFHLTDDEARAVVRYFSALSDMPADFESPPPDALAGPGDRGDYPRQLEVRDPKHPQGTLRVTVKDPLEEAEAMFGQYQCKSCHSSDESVPIGNRAPNFRHARAGRLRASWIEKWLWNPGQLQQGTAMPAFFLAEENGRKVAKAQDAQFFHADAERQIRGLRDFIRYHYEDDR